MALTGWSTSNYLRRLSQVFNTYPMVISAWGITPSVSSTIVAVTLAQSGQDLNRRAQLHLDGTGPGAIAAQVTDGVGHANVLTTTNASVDTWFQMTGEYISTAARAVLLNAGGRPSNETTSKDPGASDSAYIGILQIEQFPWDSSGALAEISIWDGSGMSDANMDSLALKLRPSDYPTTPGGNPINIRNEVGQPWSNKLVAYWIDANNTITDLSGNGHDLSLVGTLNAFGSHPTIDPVTGGSAVAVLRAIGHI